MHAPSGHLCTAKQADSTAGRPLTPFERLMLADERPGHPMCFFLECTIDGPLAENRLKEAVQTAGRRHPLLCSRVGFRRGRPRWLEADVLPTVVWNPPAQGDDLWRSFDLSRESGVRIVVLSEGALRHRVVMQVHHSTCDGVAACEFAGDLWAAYAGIEPKAFSPPRTPRLPVTADQAPESGSVDRTDDMHRETWALARFWPSTLARVSTGHPTLKPRLPSADDSSCDPRSPPYGWSEFDATTTERLRAAASANGVSLNDSIVAAVMRAVVTWNTRAGRRAVNVRVTMPVNLRLPGQREPANNNLGYAFLDRTAPECSDPKSLATSIATATRWILDHDAAAFFLGAIQTIARWPGLLALTTRLPLCISTVVVSNIGDPSRRMRSGVGRIDGRDAPADLVIDRFLGVPPLRPRTRAAIGVTTYAGRLALCCLCSAHPDPHEAARLFLDLVTRELEEMAGIDATVSPALPPT